MDQTWEGAGPRPGFSSLGSDHIRAVLSPGGSLGGASEALWGPGVLLSLALPLGAHGRGRRASCSSRGRGRELVLSWSVLPASSPALWDRPGWGVGGWGGRKAGREEGPSPAQSSWHCHGGRSARGHEAPLRCR